MSARRPEDVARLHDRIVAVFQQNFVELELFVPWAAQQLRKDIYANCEVLSERADEDGAFFHVRGEPVALEKLQAQLEQVR
jgi:GTP-binding protein HflX